MSAAENDEFGIRPGEIAVALPERFDDVAALEEFMTAPSPALAADLARLDGDLMVCVLDADRQVPEWDVARKTTRMNIVAEAVLRANGFDDDAAKVMFHRTAGAYFV